MGQLTLWIALVTSILAVLAVLPSGKRIQAAQALLWVHAVAVVLASGVLLNALLTHRFQYHYVYANTDSSLAWPYLLSAFWAGQQGSLLFWALCGAVASLWVVHSFKAQGRGALLATLAAGQGFLLWFLVQDSPFRLMKSVPAEGLGLNPLLLNPWMVIHPPIIFIAYALLIIPLAFAVAALVSGEYQPVLGKSLPWALLGWLFLGAGIVIGGVWAYQVLGWGGYWAWDPVENSSLIPWLVCGALVHGLLVQKKRGGFLRLNLLLAMLTYVLVILATFITRSGIMANYSVHAFASTPLARWIGLYMLLVSVGAGGLYAWRYGDLASDEGEDLSFLSRGLAFGSTIVVLLLAAGLILIGTLAPIISGWFGLPATVDSSFYLRTNAPLAAGLLLLLGAIPLLGKRGLNFSALQENLALPLAALAAVVLGAFVLGVKSPLDLIFLGCGAFGLASNLEQALSVGRKRGLKYSGGYLAHVGIALILMGFLVSTNYTRSATVYLAPTRPVAALGYEFTWLGGLERSESLSIEVAKGSYKATATPKMGLVAGRQMREPGIRRGLWSDVYLSPIEVIAEFPGQILSEEGRYFAYGEHSIHFSELRQEGTHGAGQGVSISASLVVRYVGDVQVISPSLIIKGDSREYVGVALPHSDVNVYLQSVDPRQGLAWFTIGTEPEPRQDLLVAEVKVKPLVSLLALGGLLLGIGTCLACMRRFS